MPQKNPFWFLMALVFMLVLAKSANITDDRLVSTTDHCTAQKERLVTGRRKANKLL